MKIDVPEEMLNNMSEGERVVGYMSTLWKTHIFLTKLGCSTKEGCQNILYRSANEYEREEVSKLYSSDLDKHEKSFISAFLWN
jgi:hypothetical protein